MDKVKVKDGDGFDVRGGRFEVINQTWHFCSTLNCNDQYTYWFPPTENELAIFRALTETVTETNNYNAYEEA